MERSLLQDAGHAAPKQPIRWEEETHEKTPLDPIIVNIFRSYLSAFSLLRIQLESCANKESFSEGCL